MSLGVALFVFCSIAAVVFGARIHGVGRAEGTTHGATDYVSLLPPLGIAIGGLVLVVLSYRRHRAQVRVFVHGAAVRGRVIRRGEDETLRRSWRHPWKVGWELVVDGRRYEGAITHMDRAMLEAAIPTDEVVVLYDPRRPETNIVYIE